MESKEIINQIVDKIKQKNNFEETYNQIQINLIENKINEIEFYRLLNMFFLKSHVYQEKTDKLLRYYIAGRFKLDIVSDENIFANLSNADSPVEFMLMIFLLIKPKILHNNTTDIITHTSQVIDNLDKLIDYCSTSAKYKFTSADSFKSICLLNYTYYHVYNGLNNRDLYIKIAKLWKILCPDLTYVKSYTKKPNENKIKIGFASSYLQLNQSVCRDRIGIIRSLISDPKYEVYLFTTTKKEDAIYDIVINSIGFNNKIVLDESIENARKIIGDLELDILVYPEIGMDMFYYLLAFSRLAPIQINTWGHSETSGIDTIDYYFSSDYYEAENSNVFYSEKLVKLKSLCTYYYSLRIFDFYPQVVEASQEILRVEKNLPKNGTIYGVFQTVFKYHPTNIDMIKNILYQDPKAIIIMLTYEELEDRFISYLDENLGYHTNRIRIFSRSSLHEYTKLIKCVDVILDSYPFGGCNSSLEAFALGKVVITLPSEKINGRFTYGFYKKMDIQDPVCQNQVEFVSKAIFYANNKDQLKKLENKIREKALMLFEEDDSIITWKEKIIEIFNEYKQQAVYEKNTIVDYDIDISKPHDEFNLDFYNKTYCYNFSNYELGYEDWKNKKMLGFKGNFFVENNIIYYSQLNQDHIIINELFNLCKNGTFVEFGACDGKFLSNTYTLEKYFDWNGILIEPDENYFNKLVTNRKATCVKELVYSENDIDLFYETSNKPELNKISLNKNGIKFKSKTLEKILDEKNCPKIIHYMSVDVEGSEFEILKNFPFNSKYVVYCVSIEYGLDINYKNKINNLMLENNYILYKELLWDNIYVLPDLLTKKVVNSFDFFDTLAHRYYFSENSILEIIANTINDKNFITHRKKIEFETVENSLEQIYKNMEPKYTNLKNLEQELEKKYLFLNKLNFNKVKQNDIIISDTYYSENELGEFLNELGIKNKYFVSKNGKKTGLIYQKLLKDYIIISHTGDNYLSDYQMALVNNVNSVHRDFGKFNNFEKIVLSYLPNISFILRKVRLNSNCDESLIETFQYIFACNLLIFIFVTNYLKKNGFNNLLLTMRDCCLIYKIFNLFDNHIDFQYKKLYTSRNCYNNSSVSFVNYFKNLLVNTKNLIIDMNGTGKSLLNFLNKNNISNCDNLYIVKFGGIKECNSIYENKYIDVFEYMNCDINGKTLDYINEPIICPTEYIHLNEINKIHELFDQTCYFIKQDENIKQNLLNDLLKTNLNDMHLMIDICVKNFSNTTYFKDSLTTNKNNNML